MSVSSAKKERVRERANNRCEYCQCQQKYVFGRLQTDHIIPTSKNGSDNLNNLCLSCELCNQYKWTRVDGIDPESKKRVLLFNPRQQRWHDHFVWAEDGVHVVGLTECGRATVATLQMNNPLAIMVRRHWVAAGWHPPSD